MPADPEKLKASYVKKAQAILRLTPDKQEKAEKKLKGSLEAKKAHIEKLEKEVELYSDRDQEGLIAYTRALQDEAGDSDHISDFKVPKTLRKGMTIDDWWNKQVEGLQNKLEEVTAGYECLYEDNKTLLDLQIDDLEHQKAIIEPLKFEDMEQHFGGKLVHKLDDKELKDIDKKIVAKKAVDKKWVEKAVKKLPGYKEMSKEERDKKLKSDIDNELGNIRSGMVDDKLTDRNKSKFKEIHDNQVYHINYRLDELQEEYTRLKREKHEKKTN